MKHSRSLTARWLLRLCTGALLLAWLVTGAQAADTLLPQAQYVIVISVDGLGGTYLNKLFNGTATGGPYVLPNFTRLKNEGAGTLAAHCDNNTWETLPNHTSIITGRPRDGVAGHNWSSNSDPAAGQTIHSNKGSYVAGVFDVAHDNGLRTGMYANKTKFSLFDTYGTFTGGGSYNATYGAPDATGADNGRDKVDNSYINTTLGGIIVNTFIAQQTTTTTRNHYAFLHINEPDAYGHSSGWGSATWNSQVVVVDTMLGKIFKLIEQDVPAMNGNTVIILTADHGNQDNPPTGADRYSVPFYVWGPGVTAGADLYALNAGTRQVASSYPMTTYAGMQPIRNAEASNLALYLLSLGPIPGSSFNYAQNLKVSLVNENPVITSNGGGSSASISIPENTIVVTTVTATDPDAGDTLTYSISGGVDAARFTINSGTGVLTFVTPPNFEAPTDANGDNVYDVTVRVADSLGNTDIQTLAVTATNVNEFLLTIGISGNGTVNSHNDTGLNYACASAVCPAVPFSAGDTVILSATGSNSSFSAWGVDYSGSGNPGSITMTSDKIVTATFEADPAKVRIEGSPTRYYTLDAALTAAPVPVLPALATEIRAQALPTVFIEDIIMTNSAAILLKGGYSDAGFSEQSGYSTIDGYLKVQAGKLLVERLNVKAQ